VALGVGTRIGKGQGEGRTARAAVAAAGRAVLWALVGLLLIRGVASSLSGPEHGERQPVAGRGALDPATGAFAVRFARAYLGGSSPQELAPLLAPGVRGVSTTTASGVAVAQAEVAGVQGVGAGQAIVTVACELDDARTIFLAVPIVRASAGEVAASGAPAVVAGPAGVGEEVDAPRPLAGPGATAIGDLVRRFLPAYFSASGPDDLAYLLAPGAEVVPPGNGLQSLGVPSVKQIGDGEGTRRTVLATARVRDPLSGETFQLGYRLEVARHGRWYVDRVEGALS
jgi:Conjugative transposon protein TcpC